MKLGAFVAAGLALAIVLAFFVSPGASSQPDGLNRVAIDKGFEGEQQTHALADLPTAGYAVRGIDNDRLSTGMAGLIGVGVTFAIAGGTTWVLRRRSSRPSPVG